MCNILFFQNYYQIVFRLSSSSDKNVYLNSLYVSSEYFIHCYKYFNISYTWCTVLTRTLKINPIFTYFLII